MPPTSRLRLLTAAAFGTVILCLIFFSFPGPDAIIPSTVPLSNSNSQPAVDATPDAKAEADPVPESNASTIITQSPCPKAPKLNFKSQNHEYARAVIRPHFKPDVKTDGRRTTQVNAPFLSPFAATLEDEVDQNCNVVDIDVRSDPKDTSAVEAKIMVGFATKIDRLKRFLPTILTTLGQHASTVALIGPESEETIKKAEEELQAMGLNITLFSSDLPFTAEYVSLVNVFAKYTDSYDWFMFLDDDTYLPNTLPLMASRLAELDPSKPHFIGNPSDSGLSTIQHGGWPHGGGSILLSRAQVTPLSTHLDECLAEFHPSINPLGGDHRIFLCSQIAERHLPNFKKDGGGTLSNFTVWPEMKQWDLGGPAEGIFEAGIPIWTFHHWVSTHWFNSPEHAVEVSKVTATAGIDSLLRRFIFNSTSATPTSKEFYILTNSYSIVRYRIPDTTKVKAEDIDLNKVEHTWDDDAKFYVKSQGENRPKLAEVKGVEIRRWKLQESWVGEGGEVGSRYYWAEKKDDEVKEESVIDITWLKGRT